MEIKDAKGKLSTVREEIRNLLRAFEDETGLFVGQIHIQRLPKEEPGKLPPASHIANIQIEVYLA